MQSKGLSSLLQHHSSKASILQRSAFFTVQLSHPYMTTGKTIALTRWIFVGKVMSLLLNMLSRLVITFLHMYRYLLKYVFVVVGHAKSCPTLCDPMECSVPGFPVLHYLPEFSQTHVHQVGDAMQPSHPLSTPSLPAFNLSQHPGLF